MTRRQKEEAEKRAKYFLILSVSRIVAELTIIIGFFIVVFFILRHYLL
jgi:hypothetical protein